MVLLGHSLGAQLGVGHELEREPCDGFVTVGASIPHYVSYPYYGLHLLLLGLSVPAITWLCGYVPKPFFGAPGPRTLMREWARVVRTGQPPFAVPRRVTTPSLTIELQNDTYAVRAAHDKFVERFIDPTALTRWVYTKDLAGEGASTHHIRWLKNPEAVVSKIIDWYGTSSVSPDRR